MILFIAIKGAEPCLCGADILFKCPCCLQVGVKLLKHFLAHVIQKLHQTVCEQSLRGATEMSKATLLFWFYFIHMDSSVILIHITINILKIQIKKRHKYRSPDTNCNTLLWQFSRMYYIILLFMFIILNIRRHNFFFYISIWNSALHCTWISFMSRLLMTLCPQWQKKTGDLTIFTY